LKKVKNFDVDFLKEVKKKNEGKKMVTKLSQKFGYQVGAIICSPVL
jgi:hypothetical protein